MIGFLHKLTFFVITVPDIVDHLLPIEETLRSRFISTIAMSYICSVAEGALLLPLVKFSGLELKNLYEIGNIKLLNSKRITGELRENVITQTKIFKVTVRKQKP